MESTLHISTQDYYREKPFRPIYPLPVLPITKEHQELLNWELSRVNQALAGMSALNADKKEINHALREEEKEEKREEITCSVTVDVKSRFVSPFSPGTIMMPYECVCGWEISPGCIIPCDNLSKGPFYCPKGKSVLETYECDECCAQDTEDCRECRR